MKLTRILNNSTFPETTKPTNVFISEELGLIAIANIFAHNGLQ